MITIVLILTAINPIYGRQEWGDWSNCNKQCDIGTQQRQRIHNTLNETESQKQYCNIQFCGEDKATSCNVSSVTNACNHSFQLCVNNTCHCSMGNDYNIYNCLPQIGNCFIRQNPPTMIGYQYSSQGKHAPFSCTTNDNLQYEVHMIGIYGASSNNENKDYEITIVPRGPVTKPIILTLTSYEATNWIINSTIDLYEVLYGGFKKFDSTVRRKSESKCHFESDRKYNDYGYGSDTGGGGTQNWLKQVYDEFGPITSFTGFYHINSSRTSSIMLEVGGNPLQRLPDNHMFDAENSDCVRERNATANCPTDILLNNSYHSWTEWSGCSTPCDVGIRSRCRYDKDKQNVEAEDEYCNLQYCSDDWTNCSVIFDCYSIPENITECENNICVCTLGIGYNRHNCLPSVGNCYIRIEPMTALGYKDIGYYYPSSYPLHSCTTNDNTVYELHVVGINGDPDKNIYMVSLLPRGPISKPIILVLSSYHITHWRINTPVKILKVVYSGPTSNLEQSTVTKASPLVCDFEVIKNTTLQYGHGTDTSGGRSLEYLTNVYDTYGPLTSFTGYYELSSDPISHIIINVGGSPLKVTYEDRPNDLSLFECKNDTLSTVILFSSTNPANTSTQADGTSNETTQLSTMGKSRTTTTIQSSTIIATTLLPVLEYAIVLLLDSRTEWISDESVLNDVNSTEYQNIHNGVISFWQFALKQHVRKIVIITISKNSSVVVDLRITLSRDATGDLIVASKDSMKKPFLIAHYVIDVHSINISNVENGHSVFLSLTSTDDYCIYLTTLTPCDTNEVCTLTGNIPACSNRILKNEDNSNIVVITVATCAVVILILVGVLVVSLLRKRRKEQMTNYDYATNGDSNNQTYTTPHDVYDEIPDNDHSPYTTIGENTADHYDTLRKENLGCSYMEIIELNTAVNMQDGVI